MSQSTFNAAALSQLPPGALPATYVETDPTACGLAKTAHLCGILGILGTGIYFIVKRKESGRFALDQMKEAFNFHVVVFAVAVALSIVGTVVATMLGRLPPGTPPSHQRQRR